MAQSYYPVRTSSLSNEKDSAFVGLTRDKPLKAEDVQGVYVESKDRLMGAIDATKHILNDFRVFNKNEWVVRYPRLSEQSLEPHNTSSASLPSKRPYSSRRSLSFADDPTFETQVLISGARSSMQRSVTLTSICKMSQGEELADDKIGEDMIIPMSDFNVLRLDLKLGSHHSSTSATALVAQLEKSSIANLLDERLSASISHIEKLRLRVEDTSSKVLVTGDLNAGKSTFVNALLRREVMPVDQQPCTTSFCEVRDAVENHGKEEVHVLKDGVPYTIEDDSTYVRGTVEGLEEILGENEHHQQMIKLYLVDSRLPSESLLNNGVVDISLIDAPGLNRDSLKTTAVFARHEEIDVVVFVVSAENHFTLSAKEFLWNASNEKAFLFIVVNKYDQIKNKEKCRRLVLEQIKQLSPRTYEDAEDLVYFVDSASALQQGQENSAFADLEQALRSFVLVKRAKSKLQPVSTYLSNILADIELLAGANAVVADSELMRAREDLALARPVLEKMNGGREVLEDSLEAVEEEGAGKATINAKSLLHNALERIGQGQLGVDKNYVTMPSYPGLLFVWEYARDVRRAFLSSLELAVKMAENDARVITTNGVDKVKDLREEHLPAGVERSRRVFMPEAMFSVSRKGTQGTKNRRISSCSNVGGAVVAGGLHGLGIGFAQRPDMLEPTLFDIFDVSHQIFLHFGDKEAIGDNESVSTTALSIVSVGLGALTMVGGQVLGMRGVLEGIVRITDILGNDLARKWVAPIISAATIGLTAYIVLELPSSIPRTVGRRIKASVLRGDGRELSVSFVDEHAGRIGRETRKVLRLASWDLRERFRIAMEERSKEVKGAEEMEKRALRAKEWFGEVGRRSEGIREAAKFEAIGV